MTCKNSEIYVPQKFVHIQYTVVELGGYVYLPSRDIQEREWMCYNYKHANFHKRCYFVHINA